MPVEGIIVKGLSVSYPGRTRHTPRVEALHCLNLSADAGTLTAVVGPNGCGKTTLLHCLAGLLRPQDGTVTISGKVPAAASCGFVFQNYRESLFPWLTVLDNIAFPLLVNGCSQVEARRKAGALLERFGRALPLDRPPYALSGGQQQLVAILRAVVHEPSVLLLDEPFGSLDAGARRDLRSALVEVWMDIRATTILVTHDPSEALLVADRVLVLTPRPGSVAHEISVDLPHPRGPAILDLPAIRAHRELLASVMAGESPT